MESLEDKLKGLGVSLGAGNLKAKTSEHQKADGYYPIEKVVEGKDWTTPFGNVFVVQKTYPHNLYANHDLSYPNDLARVLIDWVNPNLGSDNAYLFLDTETSGLAGGTGTFPFLTGLGFFDKDGFKLVQIFMRHPEEEPGVLAALSQLIVGTNIIVTFNGKSFDVPLLNTRHKLHGFKPVFQKETHSHIDMLPMARRIWKSRLPSRTLGDLEREILNIDRTDEEIPGWMIPDLYFDYLSTGDARQLSRVFYHNAMDIISLALLFIYTNRVFQNPLVSPIENIDLASVARIYESQNKTEQAINLYEASINQGLPVDIYIQAVLRYANIFKQQKAWEKAIPLWQKAADKNSIDAEIELAKYYEHIARNISLALFWTNQAIKTDNIQSHGVWSNRLANNDLNRRLLRLKQKMKVE